ncbi:hypothetical protein TNCV_2736861 [Trichonephila clavipes]|nr:hypothetical protein TNCV_2736861 [Trichonephila clavipes]
MYTVLPNSTDKFRGTTNHHRTWSRKPHLIGENRDNNSLREVDERNNLYATYPGRWIRRGLAPMLPGPQSLGFLLTGHLKSLCMRCCWLQWRILRH